ncbi:hypothetical protein BC936DRAFT_138879 [Jimgerdemannia flammicorona]|uniref:Uncharacterized protein n=2 Tax=Jimgerdemannia flammicorona TaxID=994334 RepID=A0A433DI23_9FUNG|nr:hypothetical protein BC936DRAFT_138879 [Jimgerdemannia flammicorona]RUS33157.1 hypothetical protein BC938DRAFT_472802 [Jimgerdemannia flammicorona]
MTGPAAPRYQVVSTVNESQDFLNNGLQHRRQRALPRPGHELRVRNSRIHTDVPTLRTQYGLTRSEIIQGVANRLMYSKFYIMLYSAMAVMSLVSIVLPDPPLYCSRVHHQSRYDYRGCRQGTGAGTELLGLEMEPDRPDTGPALLHHPDCHLHGLLCRRARGGHPRRHPARHQERRPAL